MVACRAKQGAPLLIMCKSADVYGSLATIKAIESFRRRPTAHPVLTNEGGEMKEIREAVEILKGYMEHDSLFTDYEKNVLPVLIDLAETVLAVGAKMPEKKKLTGLMTSAEANRCGYNDAIYDCTLAFAGMGLSVEEIEEMLRGECQVRWKEQGYNVVCGHPLPCPKHQKIETWRLETATEIHKAWEGKVRG